MITAAILLFVMGVALLLAEMFLPGGIVGIFGALCLVASTILGCYALPDYTMFIITGEILAAVIAMGVGLYMLTNTPLGDGVILKTNLEAGDGYVSNDPRDGLEGKIAQVATALRPAGTIVVGGERIAAVSDSSYIDDGATVRIIEVHGNRVVVEQVQQEDSAGGVRPNTAS